MCRLMVATIHAAVLATVCNRFTRQQFLLLFCVNSSVLGPILRKDLLSH